MNWIADSHSQKALVKFWSNTEQLYLACPDWDTEVIVTRCLLQKRILPYQQDSWGTYKGNISTINVISVLASTFSTL